MTRTFNFTNTNTTTQAPDFDMDFVAPYSPMDCAAQLKQFVEEQANFPVRTRIRFRRLKSGSVYFCMDRSFYNLPVTRRYRGYNGHRVGRSNYVKIQIEGHLTGWADSGSTIVVGRGRTLPKTYLVNGVFLLGFALLVLLLTTAFLGDFLCLAPLLLLMVVSFAYTTVFQPEMLGEKYKKALIRQIITTLHS